MINILLRNSTVLMTIFTKIVGVLQTNRLGAITTNVAQFSTTCWNGGGGGRSLPKTDGDLQFSQQSFYGTTPVILPYLI